MATSGALSTSNQYVKYTISITQNSQSVSGNTSNVTVSVRFYRTNSYTTYGTGTVYCKINGTTYSASVTPSQKITSSGIVLFTKTLNIAHNSDGTKTLTCSAWIDHNAPLTSSEQSYSQTLTTIPRKSSLSVGNGTLGTAQTLTVTRKSTSFTHTITYVCGNDSGTICTKSTSTSISWTPPLALANNAPNGTAATISITITTYNGSTSIGSNSYSIKCSIPDSVKPTLSMAVTDAAGYFSTYGAYVQGKSTINVVLTASGVYNSTIRSYSTTADGKTYTTASFTTPVIAGNGSLAVSAKVTDSRSRSATESSTISVLPYSAPQITEMNVKRSNANGNSNSSGAYLTVTFSSAVSNLTNKNSASYTVKYKKTGESMYTTATLTDYAGQYAVSNGVYTFAAETSSSYEVVVTVTDDFLTTSRNGIGSSIKKLFSWLHNGLGWAFGKVAEKENALEVDFDTYLNKEIYDQFGLRIGNGLASYTGSGDAAIDPDTTTETHIVTNKNTPMGTGYFMHIFTGFYSQKSDTANRVQVAIPHNRIGSMYHRYCVDSTWSDWRRLVNEDEQADYVVEQGTSGIWTYRKWNSGIAECWGRIRATYYDVNTLRGTSNLPFTFSGNIAANVTKIGGTASFDTLYANTSYSYTTTTFTAILCNSGYKFASGDALDLSVHLLGTSA